MQDTLDFFKNRVECNNPEKYIREHFDHIKVMYTFISPVINYIDKLVIDDQLNYRIEFSNVKDIREGLYELIDKSSVRIKNKEYRAVTTVVDNHAILSILD